jgi:hypothetical protein
MGGVVTTLPASPPPLTSDTAPTTLAEFHGQNAWSQAVVNTTGGNVSLDAGIGTRKFLIVANVAAPGLAGSTFTINANTTSVTLTAVAGAPGANQFQIGTDDTAPQLAVTATNFAAAVNASALSTYLTATPLTQFVYFNLKSTTDTCTIATNANAANATATSGVDGTVNLNGLQILAPDGLVGSPSYSFAGDRNTGIFRSGADKVNVAANGTFVGEFGDTGAVRYFMVPADASAIFMGSGADCAILRESVGVLKLTDGSLLPNCRLLIGGDTVGGIGLGTAMMAGWGSP